MRSRLLQLLEFPRQLVRGELELEDCPHDGFYDLRDTHCIDCPQGPECHWLCSNDEFASLEMHSTGELTRALDFALCYVRAGITKWEHDPEHCRCAICAWFREARELYDDAASLEDADQNLPTDSLTPASTARN